VRTQQADRRGNRKGRKRDDKQAMLNKTELSLRGSMGTRPLVG